jgi:glycosyltransferase involved in cell wall biosynthesis
LAEILFVHRHGPGQFVHLAAHLAQQGHGVTLLSETTDREVPGVRVITHRPAGRNAGRTAVDYQVQVATRAAEAMERMKRQGEVPDVIYGHVGWGSLLFARDIFPSTPMVGYCEFYYRPKGADVGFDPAQPVTIDDVIRLKVRNFAQVSTMLGIEAGVSPTKWQRTGYPEAIARRIAVIHEGIDTAFCCPDETARFTLPDGRVVRRGDRVVTFAARDLEPYRGFPQFMRAAALLARRDPKVTFVVAGGDGASYGALPENGRSWREVMLAETGIDPKRIHFVGTLAHRDLIRLFQVSAAHVYLTYPFVLSWSMLEAMASGALLIGSDTPPVREFLSHGRNGLMVPFFDTEALAETIAEALREESALQPLRAAARQTILNRAALAECLKLQAGLVGRMISDEAMAPA